MPSINLTDRQLEVLARALAITLAIDEGLGKLEALGVIDYPAMSGEQRRELRDLQADVQAIAREHA